MSSAIVIRPVTPTSARVGRAGLVTTAVVVGWLQATACVTAAEPPSVLLETTAGETVTGGLLAITADEVRLDVDAQPRVWPVKEIRRLLRRMAKSRGPYALTVTLVGGGRISGDDFSWAGDRATLAGGPGAIELPIDRVQSVAWRQEEAGPDWRAALPEKPESDLIVVARSAEQGDTFEFVECAITQVGHDTVTVVLDGETIPVKRGKVLGLFWVREPRVAGGTMVEIMGGNLSADVVTWSDAALVLDGVIRIPADGMHVIDYAAGRTVRLADVAAETTAVEPFFGGLAAVEGVAGFFAPRFLPARAAGEPSATSEFLVRPRTTVTWRVPQDSQRFVASIAPAGGRQAAASTQVTVSLDGKPLWERRVDAAEQPPAEAIRLDVANGRRLTITVDFVQGTMGSAIRFLEPVFEK